MDSGKGGRVGLRQHMPHPPWKPLVAFLLLGTACAMSPQTQSPPQHSPTARGPWTAVPAVELPAGDTSVPISLLRDMAEALLKLPGARACDPMTQRPLVGLSTEYCSTLYVAGDHGSLSWRVTEPRRGSHNSCNPLLVVKDADYPAAQVWVMGFVHNHPCGAPPSSLDLSAWPTDAFEPYVAMAEVRLIPGNPAPAAHNNTPLEMASAVVAERQDGARIFLRYFPTGEVQQWSSVRDTWVTLDFCTPGADTRRSPAPQCSNGPLQLLRE